MSDYSVMMQVAVTPGNPVMRSYSNAGMNRKHQFVQKTEYKRATCGVCNKRVKFGKIVYKCRECGAVCHPECKDQVEIFTHVKVSDPHSHNALGSPSLCPHRLGSEDPQQGGDG